VDISSMEIRDGLAMGIKIFSLFGPKIRKLNKLKALSLKINGLE